MKADILEIAKQARLQVNEDDINMSIYHKISLSDKSIWGLMLFLFGGIFMITISFVKASDIISEILGIAIGSILLVVSILTITRQILDQIKINDTEFSFRYNLKKTSIPLTARTTLTR